MLDRFAVEYQQYHGLSAERSKRQRKEIEAFSDFSGKPPEQCDAQDLRLYLSHLVGTGLHVNSVRFKGNLIRPFFRWAWEIGVIDADTYLRVKAVPDPNGASGNGEPKPYSAKELKQFWADLDARWPYVDEKWLKRWRQGTSRYKRIDSTVMRLQIEAIIALALDCGLRRIEIFEAEIDHIHPDNQYVVVVQRGERTNGKDKAREVPLTQDARLAIHRWLEMRAELKPKHDRPWISAVANQAEGGWLKPMLFSRFKSLLLTIGDYQLHRFRHTCATIWLRAGNDLEIVQRQLGHANINQTLRYAKIVRDDVQKQVEANEGRFRQMTGRRAA